ncbi:MAG: hypothetical protein NTZ05_23250 [Chloroflexi bacterium]|nr:hypothetical protein [Chloroflexota bacterium]
MTLRPLHAPAASDAADLALPTQLYIEVTNRCQSLCTTCPLTFGGLEPNKDLTWDEFRLIVGQFPTLERVVLHGIGEPLLNRNLAKFILYLKEHRGSYCLFNSNAISLTPARAPGRAPRPARRWPGARRPRRWPPAPRLT